MNKLDKYIKLEGNETIAENRRLTEADIAPLEDDREVVKVIFLPVPLEVCPCEMV